MKKERHLSRLLLRDLFCGSDRAVFVYAMEVKLADLTEMGIPSDPTAEGPVIQRANVRALSGGVTTDKVFDMVVKIRKNSSVPMVFMTYANVVFSYGTSGLLKQPRNE